ncbi:MAG: adenosylcobinamide-GDP ribazoletransferase [Bacillota bacterium]|nr:adenosylcobinamide-GDP ribazoletransferase [Bacillota bacterium]
MRYVRGFLMAWGNFSAVPCPYKKWHQEDRTAMLCMLPLVGMFMAMIVTAGWALLSLSEINSVFKGALLTALYFWLTGFIHLDGFMDCSDAILSRRRSLAERQRILKDSHVGAFAVIALVFMVLLFTASMSVIAESFSLARAAFFAMILVFSRGLAAYNVIRRKPMDTSQYSDLTGDVNRSQGETLKKSRTAGAVVLMVTVVIILGMYALFLTDWSHITGDGNRNILFATALTVVSMRGFAGDAGRKARKQLGGMNGDISGYMIVIGELVGIIFAAISAWALM